MLITSKKCGWVLSLALLFAVPEAHATWMEVGDAGQLPGTAQQPLGTGLLTSISGSVNADADMFLIFINDPDAFSATTNAAGTNFDTQLFLFDQAGFGVLANDDAPDANCSLATGVPNTFSVCSTIPALSLSGATPGIYLLAVSAFDFDPKDATATTLLFPNTPFNNVFGPSASDPVGTWDGVSNTIGTYEISLTGVQFASVPEPSTLMLFGIGLLGLGWMGRRRAA